MSKSVEDREQEQRRHQLHAGNLQGASGDDANVKALQQLSGIDIPIDADNDDVLQTWKSSVNSTSKLSEEKRVSHEWEREIVLTLEVSNTPTKDGMHGSWQGWAHGNSSKAQEPMEPNKRKKIEAGLQTANLALTRSDEGFAIKESLRGVKQSLVGDEQQASGGGGILGKIGLR